MYGIINDGLSFLILVIFVFSLFLGLPGLRFMNCIDLLREPVLDFVDYLC